MALAVVIPVNKIPAMNLMKNGLRQGGEERKTIRPQPMALYNFIRFKFLKGSLSQRAKKQSFF